MEQFTVPQFIEVEDKIIGPITTRQFLIMLATTLLLFVAYRLADFQLFIVSAFLIGGSGAILAFLKINGMPFHYFLLNIFQTIKRPSRRMWVKNYNDPELKEFIKESVIPEPEVKEERRVLSNTTIKDLSLLVNTGGYYKPE